MIADSDRERVCLTLLRQKGFHTFWGLCPLSVTAGLHFARRLSGRVFRGESWEEVLRRVCEWEESGYVPPSHADEDDLELGEPVPTQTPKSLRDWLGSAYTSKPWHDELIAVVCGDASTEEKLTAFAKLSALQSLVSDTRYAEKVTTVYTDENPYASVNSESRVGYEWEDKLRRQKKRGKQRDSSEAVRITRNGVTTSTSLGNDVPAIRSYLHSWAQDRSWELEHLSAKGKRGHSLTDEDRARFAVLAAGVRAALADGAKRQSVGVALGWRKQAVSDLLAAY